MPIFDTIKESVEEAGANTSMIFVPARFAAPAIDEAIESGVETVIAITEGIPVLDMLKTYWKAKEAGVRLIGPNCPGVLSPGKANVGIIPAQFFDPGSIGVVSKSGTLTYQIGNELKQAGAGNSSIVGIGGDPIVGSDFIDILTLYEADPETELIVMVGEIGGDAEERAAEFIASEVSKPVVAYIAGFTAPPGKQMGHAGAIISGSSGTAQAKKDALEAKGVRVGQSPTEAAAIAVEMLRGSSAVAARARPVRSDRARRSCRISAARVRGFLSRRSVGDADGAVAGDEEARCRGRGRAGRRRGGRGIPSCRARRSRLGGGPEGVDLLAEDLDVGAVRRQVVGAAEGWKRSSSGERSGSTARASASRRPDRLQGAAPVTALADPLDLAQSQQLEPVRLLPGRLQPLEVDDFGVVEERAGDGGDRNPVAFGPDPRGSSRPRCIQIPSRRPAVPGGPRGAVTSTLEPCAGSSPQSAAALAVAEQCAASP